MFHIDLARTQLGVVVMHHMIFLRCNLNVLPQRLRKYSDKLEYPLAPAKTQHNQHIGKLVATSTPLQ